MTFALLNWVKEENNSTVNVPSLMSVHLFIFILFQRELWSRV
jgi:hypothetical protein